MEGAQVKQAYEAVRRPGEMWKVETEDCVVMFSGGNDEKRAKEYATWLNRRAFNEVIGKQHEQQQG